MNALFCPRCHKRIEPPAFLKGDKVNILGTIILTCGNCKIGQVKIKLKKPEQKGGADQGDNKKEIQDSAGPENPADSKTDEVGDGMRRVVCPCGHIFISVCFLDSKELECPACGKMVPL
jgi:hypothetical protein